MVDKYHDLNKSIFEKLNIKFDIYSRTSSENHKQFAQNFFLKLFQTPDILKEKISNQFYSKEYNMFLADRFITGTCPYCLYDKAHADHCENCDHDLEPWEINNPKSNWDEDDKSISLELTRNLAFNLPLYTEKLKAWIDTKSHWKKQVLSYCKESFEKGLYLRDITRDLKWGIPVPSSLWKDKVLYVWFEAPIAYISFTKELLPETWEEYWKDPNTKLIHFIGKDNISFHSIFFPAMLIAHGEYVLPTDIPANEFLNETNKKLGVDLKFSKSRGTGVKNFDIILKEINVDSIRYYLTSILPENKDSVFDAQKLVEKHNTDLIGKLGNLINRVVSYYYNNQEKFPNLWKSKLNNVILNYEVDFRLKVKAIENYLENYQFKNALNETMRCVDLANEFFQDAEPWDSIKTHPELCISDIEFCLNLCYWLAILLYPFIPSSSEKIIDLLGFESDKLNWNNLFKMDINLSKIKKPEKLFPYKLELSGENLFIKK